MPAPTLDSLLSQSLRCMDRPTDCCCGRVRCAYLEHNNAALEGLERDLQNAAQIGQVSSVFLSNASRIQSPVSGFETYSYSHLSKYNAADFCAPGAAQQA
jgi:hypothetical protein